MAWLLSDRQVASHGGRDTSDCDLQRDVACRDAGRDLDVYLVEAGISGSDSGVLDVGRWEGHGAEGNGYGCRDGRGSWREDAWGVGRTGCAEAGHEDGKDVAGLGRDEGCTGDHVGRSDVGAGDGVQGGDRILAVGVVREEEEFGGRGLRGYHYRRTRRCVGLAAVGGDLDWHVAGLGYGWDLDVQLLRRYQDHGGWLAVHSDADAAWLGGELAVHEVFAADLAQGRSGGVKFCPKMLTMAPVEIWVTVGKLRPAPTTPPSEIWGPLAGGVPEFSNLPGSLRSRCPRRFRSRFRLTWE